MKKILILMFIVELFHGCTSMNEPKHQSMLEILNSYKGSGKDSIKIKGLVANEIEVTFKRISFFIHRRTSYKEPQEIQKEVDREN